MIKMLKNTLSVVILLIFFASCTEETPVLEFTGDDEDPELAELITYYETEYGVAVKYKFDKSDFRPVNVGHELTYKPTKHIDGIKNVLTYLEDSVLNFFSKEFINEKIPRNILLVDSLIVTYDYNDKVNNVIWDKIFTIPGYVTNRYWVIGNVSERFDPNAEGLREEMTSMLVEHLLFNNTFPLIDDFVKATEDAMTACGVSWMFNTTFLSMNYPYWTGDKSALSKQWGLDYEDGSRWLGWSVLKSGRCGALGYENSVLSGIRIEEYLFDKGTPQKDFADFTAFILNRTPAQKEAFYAAVAAHNELSKATASQIEANYTYLVLRDGVYYDGRFPYYGGEIGANAIRQKAEIVKSWWQTLGITLQEPQ
jgi:hypothetical protein